MNQSEIENDLPAVPHTGILDSKEYRIKLECLVTVEVLQDALSKPSKLSQLDITHAIKASAFDRIVKIITDEDS